MIRAAALLAAGLAFGGGAAAQVGGDLKPPHVAHVSFEPLEGDGTQIAPGAAFRIAIDVMNAAGADAPAGLTLFGWLRRSDPANLPCTEAAESFFRTGRLPVGAVFLNDPLVAMLTEDDALHLVDPEFSLATANILGAVKLASRPGAVAVDPDLRRLLVLLPEEGRVVAVDTAARQSVLAEGLTRPEAVLPVADGGVIALDAGRLVRRPEGPVPDIEARALVPVPSPVPGSSEALALGARAITLFDRDSGAVRLHWDVHASAALPLHGPDGTTGLAAAVGSELLLRYLDAPDAAPLRIPLAAPARALVVSRDGRFVFAHDPAGGRAGLGGGPRPVAAGSKHRRGRDRRVRDRRGRQRRLPHAGRPEPGRRARPRVAGALGPRRISRGAAWRRARRAAWTGRAILPRSGSGPTAA
ncbi:hypothetical protein LVO79_20365 (plasmid) [Roseivivax marinus]|uniref:hypothetical protein n=1 Tax=Roseivivax marinus TaxID=1379903 RepID=UPI001F04A443|nr:hypothetical protein [Roseivivax marinus]UMA66921.1 hypothetical protein LVO79_20365 [Roseivivax marinus]